MSEAGGAIKESGATAIIAPLAGKLHDMCFELETISVERGIVWTVYVGDGDPRDPDWGAPILRDLTQLRQRGIYMMPRTTFQAWKAPTAILDKWKKKIAHLGMNYLTLIPLYDWEFPNKNADEAHVWEPAIFASELAFEGNSLIEFGPKGSGKTVRAIDICEQLDRLKIGQQRYGRESLFGRIRGARSEGGFVADGLENRRLGLWDAADIRFVANFSVYDRKREEKELARFMPRLPIDTETRAPRTVASLAQDLEISPESVEEVMLQIAKAEAESPIRWKWARCETVSDTLLRTAEFFEQGFYTVLVTDEAGISMDRNRVTTKKVTALRGYARFIRKLNQSWILLTQHEKSDLPDDVIEEASTIITLLRPPRGSPPKKGIFTIPGVMKERRLTGLAQQVSAFDTEEFPALIVDIDITSVVEYVSQKQGDAERAGSEWGRAQRAHAIKEACVIFKSSESDIAAGRSAAQIAEVKLTLLRFPKSPATHKEWSIAELSEATGAAPDVVESTISEVARMKRMRAPPPSPQPPTPPPPSPPPL